jgi:chloramphenicol 3-O-phosphotransferase
MRYTFFFILISTSFTLFTKETAHFFSRTPQPNKGKIILISGLTSCGKSSSSKELQKLLSQQEKPFVILGMDEFIKGLPKEWAHIDKADSVNKDDYKKEGVHFEKVYKTPKELERERKNSKKYYKDPLKYKFVPFPSPFKSC